MQLGLKPDLEFESIQPKRTWMLLISLGIHVLLIGFIALDPGFLQSTPKRIIRIAGQDYDLSKNQLTELVSPPPPSSQATPPPAAQNQPLVQPPQAAVQPPPPPPPPPPPAPPPRTISPEDIIAEGARPDGSPRASRGETEEPARVASGAAPEPPAPAKPPEPRGDEGRQQIAENTNPNALRLPNLLDRAGRIVEESAQERQRRYIQNGPQTGIQRGAPENPNFSTEEPTILSDTRGYDFGPYMNQVVNRVRLNWYSLIPEIARLGKKGRVVIIFTITESGVINDLRLVANSGTDPLDRAATGAITASNPFPTLPPNFDGDHIVLQFTFLYNLR